MIACGVVFRSGNTNVGTSAPNHAKTSKGWARIERITSFNSPSLRFMI